MKKILLIATGGTIASKHTEQGLAPQISAEEILSYIPAAEAFCQIDTEAPLIWIVRTLKAVTGSVFQGLLRKNMSIMMVL